MSQYLLPFIDPDIVTGSQLAQWLNQWAPAIQTAQTGSSRPASVTAGFLWLEQASPTVWNYKLFDGTEDIILLTVNPTTNVVSFPGMGTLGTAAAADIITSPTDSTAGRVITVGGGGLLGNAPFAADANAITSSRFSSVTAGTTNTPVAQTGTLLTIIDGTNGSQTYHSATTGSMYRRSRFGGSWGAWSEVWTATNLVKQTGASDATAGRVLLVGASAAALGADVVNETELAAGLAPKAPLASPALTGTPTTPTAADGTNTTQIASTAFVQTAVAQSVVVSPFTKEYISAEQTITPAGLLTLPHGFGAVPKLWMRTLVCKTANLGYDVGDIIDVPSNEDAGSYGMSIAPDDTNFVCRFGSIAGVFVAVNKTTGATAAIAPASWKFVLRAWA